MEGGGQGGELEGGRENRVVIFTERIRKNTLYSDICWYQLNNQYMLGLFPEFDAQI